MIYTPEISDATRVNFYRRGHKKDTEKQRPAKSLTKLILNLVFPAFSLRVFVVKIARAKT